MTGSINDVFGSASTLSASDLPDHGEVPTTIISAEVVNFTDGNKIKLGLQGTDKTLLCNKTNANKIADAYGPFYAQWVNKQIMLYREMVDFQGKRTPAIRVRAPQPQVQQGFAPAAQQPPQQGFAPQPQQPSPQQAAPAFGQPQGGQFTPPQQPPQTTAQQLNDDIPF